MDFFSLQTADDAVLDSIEFSCTEEYKKPMSQRKFVIMCLANGQNYIDWIKDYHFTAKEIGCTVIGFNYRGIDYSQGMIWTEDNMISDAMAQVRRLVSLGANPANIGIEGMCLGGTIATLTCALAHDRQLKVKLFNERGYRSIPRALAGVFLPRVGSSLWNPINWLRYLLAAIVYVVSTPFIGLAGWYMDAGSRWDRIPSTDKGYAVVRNFNDSDPNAPKEDGIVEDSWASIAS